MFAVGMLGSYLTQGVYAVAGPFQPFGGAVDIIVVEQEDGSFKSSPWYVKFGDFQGALKSQEKIVNISVNDIPADFHMFLDNKGEAYFEKEVDVDGSPGEDGQAHDVAGSENQQGHPDTLSSNEDFSNDISQTFELEAQSIELSRTFIEERIHMCDESVTACTNNSNHDKGDQESSYVHNATETQCVSITMDSIESCALHSVVLDEEILRVNKEGSLDVSPDESFHNDLDANQGLSSEEKIGNSFNYNYESLLEGGIASRSSSTLSFDPLQTQSEQYESSDLDTQHGTFDESKFSMDDNTIWWKLEKQNTPEESDIHTSATYNDTDSGPCAVDTNVCHDGEGIDAGTCGHPGTNEMESADQTSYGEPRNGSLTSNTLKTEDVVITVSEENIQELTTENLKSDSETKDMVDEGGASEERENRVGRSASAATSSPSKWRLWPLSFRRSRTERDTTCSVESQDSKNGRLESSITEDVLQKNGYYKWPQKSKVRTYVPSAMQLASLKLKDGPNKVTFTFSRNGGKTEVDARIYLWKWNTRIVISDVDGTITKSDVLGQVMPLVGRDWSQYGVTRLFSAIKDNGYEVLFLSARAISQAYLTRRFLLNLKQDGEALPEGPVFISPDGLIPSLYREVIRRAPHEFKISCLEGIRELFPKDVNPFYAGFGNRITDEISYLKVGIPKGKIFIINPKGEVVVNRSIDCKSYTSLHTLVDDMFPPKSSHEQEDFNSWNFWKMPLPDIEDELNIKGSKNTKRSKK